jgi:prepilin signal peptidase PulO-like enzyme (type II secretory pathway)
LSARLAFGPFLALAMLERLFFGQPAFLRALEP